MEDMPKLLNPKVSVIVPVYNVERYLRRCLDSLVNQTLEEIEIILINDGSTDGSLSILEEYALKDSRIRVINQENQKQGAARNNGLKVAQGEYVGFVDSDDWVDEDFLEKLYNSAKNNDADISVATIIRKREYVQKYRVYYTEEKVYETLKDKIEICNIPKCCYVWNKLYKKELLIGFDFTVDRYFEDVLWLLEIIKKANKIVTVPNSNYYYWVNNNSTVKKLPSAKKQEDSYFAKKYVIKFFRRNNLELIDNYKNVTKKIRYILNIPFLKLKERDFYYTWYLFGFIPIFRYRDFDSHYIFKIFNIRISIKHKSIFNYKPAKNYGLSLNDNINPRLIVSLTSHPPRIKTAVVTINTLLRQTLKPNKLILWLAESQFPKKEKDLPKELLELRDLGLEIRWCEDFKSYKKLIPALKEFPNDIIITADDDLYYEEDWLESLYQAYQQDKRNIYVKRAVKMQIKNGNIVSYPRDVQLIKNFSKPAFTNQLMGGSGCLIPPNSLHEDIFNTDLFMSLIPTHDDIYIWIMAILKGTKIGVVDGYNVEMISQDETHNNSLCKINNKKGQGIEPDEAFKRIVNKYPEVIKILQGENDE